MRALTIKPLLVFIAVVVSLHFAWDIYQDLPSVTGFVDHTFSCHTGAVHGTVRNPFV